MNSRIAEGCRIVVSKTNIAPRNTFDALADEPTALNSRITETSTQIENRTDGVYRRVADYEILDRIFGYCADYSADDSSCVELGGEFSDVLFLYWYILREKEEKNISDVKMKFPVLEGIREFLLFLKNACENANGDKIGVNFPECFDLINPAEHKRHSHLIVTRHDQRILQISV